MISRITYPIRIWTSMDLKRRPRGVVKTMIKCALDVSENLKNSSIMDRTKGVHELTNHTHGMWNIRVSDSEINQTTNQLTITSSIWYRFTIQGRELGILFQGSGNSFVVCDIGVKEKVRSIFSLGKIVSIRGWGNLKPKKIVESAQIFHLKMLNKEVLKRANTYRIISNNNHVINIKKNKMDKKYLSLYSWALFDRKILMVQLNCVSIIL